jgi:hypothetical protein
VIEYAMKFLQLSRFSMYLIPNEEKKAKKFERGLNSRIRIMINCFYIKGSKVSHSDHDKLFRHSGFLSVG